MLPVIINHIHVCHFSLHAVTYWIIVTGVELAAVPLGINGPAKGRRGQNSVGVVKEDDTEGKLVKL